MAKASVRKASAPRPGLDIRPLTRETWPALSALFQEGGDPKWCWCAFWRTRGSAADRSHRASNRALLRRLAGREDLAPGLVALRNGRAVGWVSLGPREDFVRLEHSKVLARVDDRPAWSIVCFVVSRRARGRGVAAEMLRAAVEYAREHGATLVEGYPIETAGRKIPSAWAYTGTVGMFEREGFRVVARRRVVSSARSRPIVRRVIRGHRPTGAAGK
jgi:ribosomal protein S18 acetylase RimI-like enzyme